MPEWDAEIAVDEALVRVLLAEQFPELDASSAKLLGEGWDNSAWVVENQWVFRFPRRQIAIPGVERELAVLPRIAPLLPVPIPDAAVRRSDRASASAGRSSVRRSFPGRELADACLADQSREDLGAELGRFLRVLHGVELDVELPVDPNRRAEMPFRAERARACIAEAAGLLPPSERIEEILEEASRLPPSEARTLVHGDLHARHVLIHDGRLAAVIDWGDVCVGDASIDLQLLWSLLPAAGRARFVEAYGPIDDERLLRARAAALYFCAMLAAYAHSVGTANLERECVAGLERALID